MKLVIASDIHGSAYYCKELLHAYKNSGADRLLLLGDLLYHGPRNDLPKEYAPKEVISMLNHYKDQIYCVRGNCDTEVDQMVLEFPILSDYALLDINGQTIYATHGHIFNKDNLPPVKKGDVLLHGHTHLLTAETYDDITILNPGSVSIPKGGNPPTYAVLEHNKFSIMDFDGNIVKEMNLGE